MNPYLQRFVAIGIPIGLFMGVIYSLQYGFPLGLIYGVLIGIAAGGLMSLLFGFLNRRSLIWRLRSKSQAAKGIHHVRRVEMQLPYPVAYHLCLESLHCLQDCQIQEEEWTDGRIVARAGANWWNWGDVVSIEIRHVDRERVQVKVSSRPVLGTALIDYGQNLENVERIAKFLNSNSGIAV